MDRITHQVRLTHWRSIIEQCSARPTGQSARAWLRENGISEKQYYYWQRRIRKEAYDQMAKDLPSPTVSQQTAVSFAEFNVSAMPAQNEDLIEQPFKPVSADALVKTVRGTAVFTNTASPDLVRSVMEVMLHA